MYGGVVLLRSGTALGCQLRSAGSCAEELFEPDRDPARNRRVAGTTGWDRTTRFIAFGDDAPVSAPVKNASAKNGSDTYHSPKQERALISQPCEGIARSATPGASAETAPLHDSSTRNPKPARSVVPVTTDGGHRLVVSSRDRGVDAGDVVRDRRCAAACAGRQATVRG
jgi:hypothetical protein